MGSDAITVMLLDASVLVATFSDEPRSEVVRQRCAMIPLRYTTPFCYFEAMNILKSKRKFQGKLDQAAYRMACSRLTAWFGGATRSVWIQDTDFLEPAHFRRVRELVDQTELDFADALQIDSIKNGYFSVLAAESRPVLATTDAELASVARAQGVRVWNVELEEAMIPNLLFGRSANEHENRHSVSNTAGAKYGCMMDKCSAHITITNK